MNLSAETLILTLDDDVLQVTLSRPQAANAINTQMGRELLGVFDELAADPASCRAVVLTGAGIGPSAPAAT
jgi:enoyl-CoA hydratase